MARRVRNYRLEYQRRIASALRRGQTRKEARGHAGDLTKSQRAAGALVVKRGLTAVEAMTKLSQLGEGRRAKVIVTLSDGTHMILIGKKGGQQPMGARKRLRELIDEFGSLDAAVAASGYGSTTATITSINVVYS